VEADGIPDRRHSVTGLCDSARVDRRLRDQRQDARRDLDGIAVLAFFGFTCAEIGKRLPILRNIGAAAICATFIPSALAYYHLLPKPILGLTTEFTKSTNFLYLFIASILSMDRRVLIKGFLKIFIPLASGSIAAAIVGTSSLLFCHRFFDRDGENVA